MKFDQEQQKEIETIKERNIKIKLSDADCERIRKLAGKSGLSVGELLENFIGDLVGGTYSNGSDERDRAEQWYERCWFSWMNEDTLLHYLLDWGHDVDDFLTAVDEKEYYEVNPQDFTEEVEKLEEGEKLWFIDEIEEITKPYLEKNSDANLMEEIEKCRKWLKELNLMLGNEDYTQTI